MKVLVGQGLVLQHARACRCSCAPSTSHAHQQDARLLRYCIGRTAAMNSLQPYEQPCVLVDWCQEKELEASRFPQGITTCSTCVASWPTSLLSSTMSSSCMTQKVPKETPPDKYAECIQAQHRRRQSVSAGGHTTQHHPVSHLHPGAMLECSNDFCCRSQALGRQGPTVVSSAL